MAETCFICGEPSDGACSWPVEKWTSTLVHDLRHGDICRNVAGTRTGKIVAIEPVASLLNPNLLRFKVQRYVAGKAKMRFDQYEWDVTARVMSLRNALCAAPVCYRHIRNLDGAFICSDHWGAQLAAIA